MSAIANIQRFYQSKSKAIAILIDPDKTTIPQLATLLDNCAGVYPDFFFIGGSFLTNKVIDQVCEYLKSRVNVPLVLFPGDVGQVSDKADAILFLSLISGRNPEYLIGKHVLAAHHIKRAKLEVIPTGYMLVDSGKMTTVSYISNTTPLPNNKPDLVAATALAGELLGMKTLFLDAGSGADNVVSDIVIKAVKKTCSLPLIVGGGINTVDKLMYVLTAGADVVVIGNHLEDKPASIRLFISLVRGFGEDQKPDSLENSL